MYFYFGETIEINGEIKNLKNVKYVNIIKWQANLYVWLLWC